jgi:D-serine deaminase-like pyridoxal phosphate-dependent protein
LKRKFYDAKYLFLLMNPLPTLLSQETTPSIWVDRGVLNANLRRFQDTCNERGVALWPHIKTHKSVAIAHLQLALGAQGLTSAKLSEAEAILPSGVQRLFIAHSLVNTEAIARVVALKKKVEQVIIAITSVAHAQILSTLVRDAGLEIDVAIAIDTGLGREGLRVRDEAAELKAILLQNPLFRPVALYTHEGHAYLTPRAEHQKLVDQAYDCLIDFRAALGGDLPLWPGCSVTALLFAQKPFVQAVRPGAYVFGDLYLSDIAATHRRDEVSLVVRSRVIDRPARDLALIDAGSKTFSSDKTPDGISGRSKDGRQLSITRVSEEHGFVTGADVNQLSIGDLVDFIPAHVCPVVNLARHLVVTGGNQPDELWPVEASGCNY